jgi:hypothetical protein
MMDAPDAAGARWPRIVAEALRGIASAPLVGVPAIRAASPSEVFDAIAAHRAPERSEASPPPFLRSEQVDAWRRVMAALDGWRGALLCESVGSGKTWIALATATQESQPAVACVPAILQPQWDAAAARAGVRLRCWSHERLSRGTVPEGSPSLVIVDEAHRFRNASTRRVKTLAPWLIGRRVLLLTATPIVNRIDDLITLLRLAVRDDALRLDGLLSLDALREPGAAPLALRRLAIRSPSRRCATLTRRLITLPVSRAERCRAAAAVSAVRSLSLSATPHIRQLLTSVLLDAASSSGAAFRAALGRYRALLLQARDAGGATRALLRHFAGEALDQLVMWDLLDLGASPEELPMEDIDRVTALMDAPREVDEWLTPILARCRDARPTVCFARHLATATLLRKAAGDDAAWVTGSAAGIGPHRMPREVVLAAFGPMRAGWRARRHPPRLLVATDVAAEGLDLQAAGRIVHVDLPWTATRLEQREGRLLRLGQEHPDVEILVRLPAPEFERALGVQRRVQRKGELAVRWLDMLATPDLAAPRTATVPVAIVAGAEDGERDLAAIELTDGNHRGVMVLSRTPGRTWQLLPDSSALPQAAAGATLHPDTSEMRELIDDAARKAIAVAARPAPGAPATTITRIHALARAAARRRNAVALARLDRLLRFAAGSHTMGERMVLDHLATRTEEADWLKLVVPDRPTAGAISARPIAALLFRSAPALLR